MFDEEKARGFYVDYLGFRVEFEHRFEPGTPLYMGLSLGDCRVNLSEHHGDACPGSTVRIPVGDLEEYHRALAAKGYKYYRPGLVDTEWNTREMVVQDPFMNRLVFYRPLQAPR
jgi:hypothetical protein